MPAQFVTPTQKAERGWTIVLAALLLLATNCSAPQEPDSKNVLLIVVDTLRPDRLGCYGGPDRLTPNIDLLASQGTQFERAYSVSPWTIPSMATMLSGLFPSNHGANLVESLLTDEIVTVPEILSREGYRTAGVVSNILLTGAYNFGQGFDEYVSEVPVDTPPYLGVSTPAVTATAEKFLKQFAAKERPFFLMVHYFDPHYRYQAHGLGAPEPTGRLGGDLSMEDLQAIQGELTSAEVDTLIQLYDEEIEYTDKGIGRLLAALEETGQAKNTVVIFTSDHGEEFVEHGGVGHGTSLYDEQVRVPLIVRVPWMTKAPASVETPVSLVSLAPTILSLVDRRPDWLEFQGQSLDLIFATGEDPGTDVVFLEVGFDHLDAFHTGIVAGRHKLIQDDKTGRLELYDLVNDPAEQTDLSVQQPKLTNGLRPVLDRQRAMARGKTTKGVASIPLSPEQLEQLRSLGYIGGSK